MGSGGGMVLIFKGVGTIQPEKLSDCDNGVGLSVMRLLISMTCCQVQWFTSIYIDIYTSKSTSIRADFKVFLLKTLEKCKKYIYTKVYIYTSKPL